MYTEQTNLMDDLADGGETDRNFYRHLRKESGLLPPFGSRHAPLRNRLHTTLLCITLIEALYIPFMAAFVLPRNSSGLFELPLWLSLTQWVFDLLFWAEITLMFRTTVKLGLSEGSEVETSKTFISKRYRGSGRLHADAFAILPLEFLAFADPAARSRGFFGGLCSLTALSLRLNRLVHAHRIGTYHGSTLLALSRRRRLFAFWCATARPTAANSLAPGSAHHALCTHRSPRLNTRLSTCLMHPPHCSTTQDSLLCLRALGRLLLVACRGSELLHARDSDRFDIARRPAVL